MAAPAKLSTLRMTVFQREREIREVEEPPFANNNGSWNYAELIATASLSNRAHGKANDEIFQQPLSEIGSNQCTNVLVVGQSIVLPLVHCQRRSTLCPTRAIK